MSTTPVPGVPTEAFVELAVTRDGLARWIRLRALRETLKERDENQASLDELDRHVAAAHPEAVAHAGRLADFFRKHGDAIDALVGGEPSDLRSARMRDRLGAAGPGFAASAEARARAIAERGQRAGDDATETFCTYLATAGEEADVTCIGTGDTYDCAYADLIALLSDEYC